MKKNYLIILLIITLVATFSCPLYSVIAFADDNDELFEMEELRGSSGSCGENLTWTLDDYGVLTISGEGAMKNYGPVSPAPWYSAHEWLTKVVINDGVSNIGEYAFYKHYSNLQSITIPESVTSIEEYAFSGCSSLKDITLPEGLTYIGRSAFYNCGMTSITIPGSVRIIYESTFDDCSNLMNVTMLEGVEDIGRYAFYHCINLATISIPKGLTEIGTWAFRDCRSLTSITVPEGLTSIGKGAFLDCYNLARVSLSEGVQTIREDAFKGCSGLMSITIPDSVTYIGESAFRGCFKLTNIFIPKGVEGINSYTFAGCGSLKSVSIPNGVKYIGQNAFWNCTSLTSITIPESVTVIGASAFDNCPCIQYIFYGGTQEQWEMLDNRPTCGTVIYSSPNRDILRIAGKNRAATAIEAAKHLKKKNGIEKFDNIVIASGTGFADALSASYLAYKKDGPILLVDNSSIDTVTDFVNENLASDGKVFIVGGKGAVPYDVDNKITAVNGNDSVIRLAGKNRYLTNILVLDEAGVEGEDLLVASGSGFADALSASAAKRPIFLVGTTLSEDQMMYLNSHATDLSGKYYVIGGNGAVSQDIEGTLKNYGTIKRLKGSNRYATSIAVADEFFPGNVDTVVTANGMNFPDGLSGGPVAAAYDAPLILVTDKDYSHAVQQFAQKGAFQLVIMGGTGVISDDTVVKIAYNLQ